jgi:hypothetical protein
MPTSTKEIHAIFDDLRQMLQLPPRSEEPPPDSLPPTKEDLEKLMDDMETGLMSYVEKETTEPSKKRAREQDEC